MQREAPGARRAAYGIGLGFGLTAGMVGVAQWILTARDLAERQAEFRAIQQRFPSFGDGTNVARGNEWYWVGTSAVAGVAMLALCLLAAFTAARALRRRHDGVVAAWIAAAISGATYAAATIVAVESSPEPSITKSILPCELPLAPVLFGLALLLAQAGANLGMRAGAFFSRNRQMS